MRLIAWAKFQLKTGLTFILKTFLRVVEVFPRLGVLRPLLSSFVTLSRTQKRGVDDYPCPHDARDFQTDQWSDVKIIEVSTFSNVKNARGIGHYLSSLFSEIDNSYLESVVFISFKNHNSTLDIPEFFRGKSFYSFDSKCTNCFKLLRQFSKTTRRITFTSYFDEDISPKFCSVLVDLIPDSKVIVYDLIPKLNLLNFSSFLSMRNYSTKYNLLSRAKLYAISKATKAEIESQGLQVENVIKYDLTKANKSMVEREKNILLFGSMNPRKNVIRTVMAWDLIQKDYPEFKLTLIGDYSKASKTLIRSVLRSGSNSIEFTGEISDLEINRLLQKSTLLVAPSTAEGLGLPLIKAIEFGTPFICAKIDSYQEIVVGTDSFFNPFSVRDISQNLRLAITSPDAFITDPALSKIGVVPFSEIV
jgi:glycosyltransferase involved in cell wall biosynthesis